MPASLRRQVVAAGAIGRALTLLERVLPPGETNGVLGKVEVGRPEDPPADPPELPDVSEWMAAEARRM